MRTITASLLLLFVAISLNAQSPLTPLAKVLNADGTLKAGVTGSLDPTGYKLTTPKGGAPRFVTAEAGSGEASWDDQFTLKGLDGSVYAIAVQGTNVYVGGEFKLADGTNVNHIAKWDGNAWSGLGAGMDGAVRAIAVTPSGEVYAGGWFVTAGDTNANYIAKWDGSSWSALGTGLNNSVEALAVGLSGEVYVGGWFANAGSVAVQRIAKWDGSSWSALGDGLNNGVTAIAVNSSGEVYAGGWFTNAGSVAVQRIAKWDGSSWSALGDGVNDGVTALAVGASGELYACGWFSTAGGTSVNRIAKWDGSSWSTLGSGISGDVYALAMDASGGLYAGGSFWGAGGSSAYSLAKWDGSSWSGLASEQSDGSVLAIGVSGSDLYVGGDFTRISGIPANCLAKWDGSAWSSLGNSVNNSVNNSVSAVAVSGTDVYVGGAFSTAGDVVVNKIAKWDGTSWSALGNGVSYGTVNALAVSGGDLYVGGWFGLYTADWTWLNNLARWDGSAWQPVGGDGADSTVNAMVVSGTDLYVGGFFTSVAGISVNHVAKWDGASWSALSDGVNDGVYALAVSGGAVYAGGSFTNAGSVSAKHVAKWDGSSWSALGAGVNSTVWALASSGGDVYVGGEFSMTGGESINYLAKWDGSTWWSVGAGVNSIVTALAFSGSDLYVGGYFTGVAGWSIDAARIARYDTITGTWSALGTGLDAAPAALAGTTNGVYVGGYFQTAGGKQSSRFGYWGRPESQPTGWDDRFATGVDGTVHAVATSGRSVYVAGNFLTAGGTTVDNVAKWDGTAWSAVGDGLPSHELFGMASSGTDLYVCGQYLGPGWTSTAIQKWNGSSWEDLSGYNGIYGTPYAISVAGSDVYLGGELWGHGYFCKWDPATYYWLPVGDGVNGVVYAIAVMGTDVFVGGDFTLAGSTSASHVAKWDGVNWTALDDGVANGVDGTVRALAVDGTDLYVGGTFANAGSVGTPNIAKWDSVNNVWSALGEGTVCEVYALARDRTALYVGGDSSSPVNYFTKWDIASSTWSTVEGGVDGKVATIAVNPEGVYLGGEFLTAGGKPSHHFAHWWGPPSGQTNVTVTSTDVPKDVYDWDTITSTVTVSSVVSPLLDVNATLNITFPYTPALVVTLISPLGTRVNLIPAGTGWTNNFTDTTLDDEAITPIANATSPCTGSFIPAEALSVFDGENPNGTWILEITGVGYGYTGTLNSWSLALTVPTVQQIPIITQQPQSQTVGHGNPASFTVGADGAAPLFYQWRKDGTDLTDDEHYSGSASATLSLAQANQESDPGDYSCLVSNQFGSVLSAAATLTIVDLPVITQHPESQTVIQGTSVSFTVAATGGGLSYQWEKDGTDLVDDGFHISGATNATLALSWVSVSQDPGSYRCRVSNVAGTTVSDPATLVVYSALYATGSPQVASVCSAGTPRTFTAVPHDGLAPFTYLWEDGQTTASMTTNAVGTYSVVVQDGAGGSYTTSVRYAVSSRVADDYQLPLSGRVMSLATQADGTFLIGGAFTNSGSIPAYIARFQSDGTLDPSFQPPLMDGHVTKHAIIVQASGKIVISGYWTHINNTNRPYIARLKSDGSLDDDFAATANGVVWNMRAQPDGKILVSGNFTNLCGEARYQIGRLNADGTLDDTFVPSNGTRRVADYALQDDGKIILGLDESPYLMRLNANGSVDESFATTPNGYVSTLCRLPNGKIMLGGWFSTVSGQTHTNIARLNADGTLDTNLVTSINDVDAIAPLPDGSVLISGQFLSMINGLPVNKLGRVTADGALDTQFDVAVGPPGWDPQMPGIWRFAWVFAQQADGKILVGGNFEELAGQPRPFFARLTSCGGSALTCTVTPDSAAICAGGAQTFTVNPTGGTAPYNYLWSSGETTQSITTNAAGTYTVTVTDNASGTTQCSAILTVNPIPEPPVAGNNGPILVGGTLNLTASPVSGATFSWTGPNGFASSQQNPSIPNATVAASGVYSVSVTVNSCSSAPANTTATVWQPYDAWKAGYFTPEELLDPNISGDLANPLHDGFPNLLKYATGSSPTNADGLARTSAKLTGNPAVLKLTFNRNTNAVDLILHVRVAGALSNANWDVTANCTNGVWGGPSTVTETGSGNPVQVEVLDTVPVTGAKSRFMKLQVIKP